MQCHFFMIAMMFVVSLKTLQSILWDYRQVSKVQNICELYLHHSLTSVARIFVMLLLLSILLLLIEHLHLRVIRLDARMTADSLSLISYWNFIWQSWKLLERIKLGLCVHWFDKIESSSYAHACLEDTFYAKNYVWSFEG